MATVLDSQQTPPSGGYGSLGVERFYQALAENLPGFERRKEQYDLTVAIAGTLQRQGQLAAQAPTGTGKSFAVGGAAIAAYLGTGKVTVIATANNSLLEQYASKDLPFLKTMFPDLKWARAKGKNNYACIDKGEKLFGQNSLFDQPTELRQLQSWYDTTQTGDREEIGFQLPEEEWQKINADDTCTGRKCSFYDQCHYYRAKDDIKNADIIITNFDLLLLALFNPAIDVFPRFDALILDEAHQLEDKAISKLEASLTHYQVAGFINKTKQHYGLQDDTLAGRISDAAARLFTAYKGLLQDGQEKQSIIPSQDLIDKTLSFQRAMKALSGEVWKFKTPDGSRERKAQENLIDRIDGAARAAMAAITNDKRSVSWVELTKTDIKVATQPFIVACKLYKILFSNPELSVICLSATLGIKGKPQLTATASGVQPVALFAQFRQRVGMVNCGEFDCPSPFNYSKNAVLYLPKPPEGVDKPQSPGYTVWMQEEILKLVELSQGRALILTTSTASLKNIHGFLSRSTTLPVKAQGPGMTNSKLIEWFKSTAGAVLVGTASFWEGISIEGDDLKLVIIDKIPFAPHTEPIQQAREAWYKADPKRKAKAFMDLQVYPACIKLMQGFGRLIRTKTDTGVVAILDPRLTYGRNKSTFLNSLPNAYRTTLLEDKRLMEVLK